MSKPSMVSQQDPRDRVLIDYIIKYNVPAVLPDTIEAGDAWGANCGPMSLAAVLGLPTVEAARGLVQPFRGFMSPTDMQDALARARQAYTLKRLNPADLSDAGRRPGDTWPALGLMRIQWEGPWLAGSPRAAYRFTHWIGVRRVPVTASPAVRERLQAADHAELQVRDAALFGERYEAETMVLVYDATPNRWVPLNWWSAWCPTLWPKRATGWHPVTRIAIPRKRAQRTCRHDAT